MSEKWMKDIRSVTIKILSVLGIFWVLWLIVWVQVPGETGPMHKVIPEVTRVGVVEDAYRIEDTHYFVMRYTGDKNVTKEAVDLTLFYNHKVGDELTVVTQKKENSPRGLFIIVMVCLVVAVIGTEVFIFMAGSMLGLALIYGFKLVPQIGFGVYAGVWVTLGLFLIYLFRIDSIQLRRIEAMDEWRKPKDAKFFIFCRVVQGKLVFMRNVHYINGELYHNEKDAVIGKLKGCP